MKRLSFDKNADLDCSEIFSLFRCLENKNNNRYNNNNLKNNFNHTFNKDILNHKNKRNKGILKTEMDQSIFQKTYDIGNSLSNIKNQLSNIVINERKIIKIPKNKHSDSFSSNYYMSSTNESNKLKDILKKYSQNTERKETKYIIMKSKQISFTILKSTIENSELISKNKELQNENSLLKENVKFLLSQIKKSQKKELKNQNEISNKMDSDNNIKNMDKKSKNKNKINSVFDILNKYKKEISSLKKKLEIKNNENEELKKYISSYIGDININIFDNINKKIIKNKHSIINKPLVKNTISFNKIISSKKSNNKISNLNPYKKKTFSKTYSSLNCHKYKNYLIENSINLSNKDNYLQTNNNFINSIYSNSNSRLNFTEHNYENNNILNSFNKKGRGRHLILIDSDFTGDEKIGTQNSVISCQNRYNDQINSDNFFFNDNFHISNNNNKIYEVKSPSSCKNGLYHRKQVSPGNKILVSEDKDIFNKKEMIKSNTTEN
jgi:hypothetical protein